jgi:hypothetical protein
MRRAAAIAVAVLLAVAAAAFARPAARAPAPRAPAAGPAAVTTRRAVLIARSVTPFRVTGSRFIARERVRVTVTPTGGRGIVRHVTASRRGTFLLGFPGVHVCAGVSGRAVGSRGSRAAFSLSAIMC